MKQKISLFYKEVVDSPKYCGILKVLELQNGFRYDKQFEDVHYILRNHRRNCHKLSTVDQDAYGGM
jgi:hypothetical protein